MKDGRPLQEERVLESLEHYYAGLLTNAEATARQYRMPSVPGDIVYWEWGASRETTAILVHGGSGSWLHWFPIVEQLAPRHRVIAVDLPGFGESTTSRIARIDQVSDGLGLLLGAAGSKHTEIVGFSFGAVVAAMALDALNWPFRLHVVSPAGFGSSAIDQNRFVPWKSAKTPEGRLSAHRRNLVAGMVACGDYATPTVVMAYARAVEAAQFDSRQVSYSRRFEALLPMARIASATWGGSDAFAGADLPRRVKLFREAHQSVPWFVVEKAGHWLQLEESAFVADWLLEHAFAE
ncbi:alpha/beta fold hydrolase [Labrys okinawensis]|uniref:alpha/beta fold hydrolase n=1 Tax=Labrys okinawensis TaxID=346911 RepID=UPI0039BCC6F5